MSNNQQPTIIVGQKQQQQQAAAHLSACNNNQSQITLNASELSSSDGIAKFSNPPWWHRRTRLERFLCVFMFLSVVLTLSLVSLLTAISFGQFTTITLNLKSILPSNVGQLPSSPEQALPQVQGNFPVVNGNGPRGRQAKQIRAFSEQNTELQPQPQQQQQNNNNQNVCLTPGCVKAAAEILKNIDESVSPCDDFYRYSCGNWIESQIIPEDKTSVSLFSVVQDDLDNKLRNLIERETKPEDPPIVGRMRNLYESCMNTTYIEHLGDEPILKLIRDLGGWPVLSGQSSQWQQENNSNWLDLLIKFRKTGLDHDVLIDLSVTPDFRNNSNHVIDLDQVSLGMPDRSYLLKGLNDSAVAAYYGLMVESASFLGADRHEAEQQMLEVLNFETKLANYSLPREERRNISSLYNKMKIGQLSSVAPNIEWRKYLTNLLGEQFSDDEEVIVNVPAFFARIDKLLAEAEPRVLQNYMIWRVVLQSISTLGKKWRDLAQNYNSVITGQEKEEPRWQQCLSSLTGTLGIAISSMYVKNHFKSDSKGQAMEMVSYIREEFLKILEEVDWMDQETKQEARLKANAISSHIGYPDELLNDTIIENLYSGLELNKGQYFRNILHLRKWSTDYSFSQLRKPNLKIDWRKHARAATVNAFYNSLDNSIEFPAGILQGAFFDRAKPNYLNFGAIGFIIGHEITHGFDDRGRQFDKDGNNRNWWNSETDERYKERAQCIVDQYSNYTVPENGLKVNGINTQGENIADNGGLKEAFRAYNEWVRRNGPEATLPGLNLTQRQLFWVSAANVWCGKYRPEVLKMRVMVGSHSPAQFRVTGPLSNIREFSETFNCPTGSPLNPVKKCSVW